MGIEEFDSGNNNEDQNSQDGHESMLDDFDAATNKTNAFLQEFNEPEPVRSTDTKDENKSDRESMETTDDTAFEQVRTDTRVVENVSAVDVSENQTQQQRQERKEFDSWAIRNVRGFNPYNPEERELAARQWTVAKAAERVIDAVVEDAAEPGQHEKLEADLANYPGGITAFFKEYRDVQDIANPAVRLLKEQQLKAKLSLVLSNEFDTEKVYAQLISSEQLEGYGYIVFQSRILLAMKIDNELGTNIVESIEAEIARDNGLTPEQKLMKIDRLLDNIVKTVKAGDMGELSEELKTSILKLDSLNSEQKVIDRMVEIAKNNEILALGLSVMELGTATTLIASSQEEGEVLEEVPQEKTEILTRHAEAGRSELVDRILTNKDAFEETEDGFKGELEGMEVFLEDRNGSLVAYTTQDEKEIPIPLTRPAAVGFDMARSEKISTERGWEDISQNPEIRRLFMENPGDEAFMTSEEGENFRHMLTLILGTEKSIDASVRLADLHVTNKQGTIDYRYAVALKTYISRKGSDYKDIKLGKTELLDLTTKWFEQGGPDFDEDMPV